MKSVNPDQWNMRTNLLAACMDRGLSVGTIRKIFTPMIGKTDKEKEMMAEALIPRVEAGEFDTETSSL